MQRNLQQPTDRGEAPQVEHAAQPARAAQLACTAPLALRAPLRELGLLTTMPGRTRTVKRYPVLCSISTRTITAAATRSATSPRMRRRPGAWVSLSSA